MASRKDELNAYTFAKRRTVAAFLQPTAGVTEEGAPRPLRAVLPGMVIGALILAAFGAWGLFRPAVPEGWDEPGRNVVIGSESTTRYVVLEGEDGHPELHPVLNLSSARLLLEDPDDFGIVSVDEDELDSGSIPRGPTLGIPYAPDRLPSAEEAARAKRWAVCRQPDGADGATRQAVFVLADRDAGRVEGEERLDGGELLYVADEDEEPWLIDAEGTRYPIAAGAHRETLLRLLTRSEPQRVTDAWLATFAEGDTIDFPDLPGQAGADAGIPGLDPEAGRVGTVLVARTGGGPQHYLVLPGEVVPVSDFTARLLLNSEDAETLGLHGEPVELGAQGFTPAPESHSIDRERHWPRAAPRQANAGERTTICSVLLSVDGRDGSTEVATWAGTGYPAATASGAATAYVTPGSGLLYRQVQGEQAEAGSVFLVTDTGLRYGVQATAPGEDAGEQAQIRLGYGDVTPVPVPARWSEFLPTGPRLDTESAKQPQGA
ncbi:type VII secretion protein EccB [Streptomyces hoynatensis]|uniref:Type VII secretion protein EccB n=1 Tax=Streptomyces hoynatensis TaxID=1141874 RepID=A0A3A9YSF2_9ACTN|nr:type VII secretion protein EccB [Streptomyces hoynatensis]RKN38729.1 type VII secretion protein EccB [Streptomyces hoynatensis]